MSTDVNGEECDGVECPECGCEEWDDNEEWGGLLACASCGASHPSNFDD